MNRRRHLALVLLAAGLLACMSSSSGDPMPDFSLIDVNPYSPTHETEISPRDHLGYVTGWYFGSTT